jgi:hypothetical protein
MNQTAGHPDPRIQPGTHQAGSRETGSREAEEDAAALNDTANTLSSRLEAGLSRRLPALDRWPALLERHIHIVLEGRTGLASGLIWTFGATSHGEADHRGQCPFIAGSLASWQSVLAGEANIAMEIVAGRIRCAGTLRAGTLIPPEVDAISELLGLTGRAGQSDNAVNSEDKKGYQRV